MELRKSDARYVDDSRRSLKDVQIRLKRVRKMPEDGRVALESALLNLQKQLESGDIEDVQEARERMDGLVEAQLLPHEKSAWREYAETMAIAVVMALMLRGMAFEAFKIPSGSMKPTLLVGDHLFTNKIAYGIRFPFTQKFIVEFEGPKRGDVVVFMFPTEQAQAHLAMQPASLRSCIDQQALRSEKDMIKRVVGVAGDTVEVKRGRLFINDVALKRSFITKRPTNNYLAPYEILDREQLDGKEYMVRYLNRGRNFGPTKVPPNEVFVMGDNRDESSDSRCWGTVPVGNIKGSALVLWLSLGEDGVRWERFGTTLN